MNPMTYKGYAARIEYSDEDGLFIGHIAGIRDIVGFHGESVAALRQAFKEAVDDYLDTCEKINKAPSKTLFGQTEPATGTHAARIGCSEGRTGEREHQPMGGRRPHPRNACLSATQALAPVSRLSRPSPLL